MAVRRRRRPLGLRCLMLGCAIVCATIAGGGLAPARPAPADEPLPGALLGRWFDLVASEVVITSNPEIHMYCPDGVRFWYGHKGIRVGRYTYRHGELCDEGTGWRYCARLRKTPEGYGLSGVGDQVTAIRFVRTEAAPPEPRCLQSIAREELIEPLGLPPTKANRSR